MWGRLVGLGRWEEEGELEEGGAVVNCGARVVRV